MSPMLAFFVGVALVVALAVPFVRYLQAELRIAQDRLYGAWDAGKVIPPRPEEPVEFALPPLPKDLQGYVDEWESPDSRQAVEVTIRQMQAAGKSATQIHNHFATERLRQATT